MGVTDYPKYYREGNMALKRETANTALQIEVPVGEKMFPVVFKELLFSEFMLDHVITTMTEIDGKTFNDYVATACAGARRISEKLNEHNQRVYDKERSKKSDPKEVRQPVQVRQDDQAGSVQTSKAVSAEGTARGKAGGVNAGSRKRDSSKGSK